MGSTFAQQPDSILNRLPLAPGSVAEPLPGGTINRVLRVRLASGEQAVLRVGPRPAAVAAGPSWLRRGALACETIVLDHVRPAVPCVPVPIGAGFAPPGPPWLLQRVIPGRPLAEVLPAVDARARAALWRAVGALARRVHGVSGPWFGTPDGEQRFGSWADMVRADAEGLLRDARRYGLDPGPFDRLLADIAASESALAAVTRPVVAHSDLDPRHIFAREGEGGWEITGVIDWEYARYVDALSESLVVEMLARPEGDPDRAAFLEGYGLDPLTLDAAAWARQAIYRGIVAGWAATDAARLAARQA